MWRCSRDSVGLGELGDWSGSGVKSRLEGLVAAANGTVIAGDSDAILRRGLACS